jgi:hypothetical protein
MSVELDNPVESLYLDGYLDSILNRKPMLKQEWEVEDFRQELAMNYLRKVPADRRRSMPDDHKRFLVKRMAVQLSNDKLRQMQRGKRDCRLTLRSHDIDLPERREDALDNLCSEESWAFLRRRLSDEAWQIFCLRNADLSWDDIVSRIGRGNVNSLRMRYCRSIRKVATLLEEAAGVCDDRAQGGSV